MRHIAFIITLFFVLTSFIATAQDGEKTEDGETIKTAQQPPVIEDTEVNNEEGKMTAPATKPAPSEEEQFDEGLFDDEEGPAASESTAKGGASDDEEDKGFIPRKITIDAVVIVNYSFSDTGESYNIKYHINMGGEVPADIGLIKGNAKVATDIGGFLAKTSAFECLLKVSIADVPYEITYKKVSDTEADITVAFKGQILEDWESLCTFLDTSGAKFNTRGAPEKWIGVALEKANPPLTKLSAPIDKIKTTTLKFSVPKQSVPDESLGTAQIEATGILTIQPIRRQKQLPEKIQEE